MKANKMTISKEQQMVMNRAISRNMEIESGMRINHHKAHKTAKDYNRQKAKKINWD